MIPFGFMLNVNLGEFSPNFPKYAKKSLTGEQNFCNISNYGILGILGTRLLIQVDAPQPIRSWRKNAVLRATREMSGYACPGREKRGQKILRLYFDSCQTTK